MEAKPNEPRGDIYMATTGNYLGFIPTLDHPEMVGVNPEVAHETMAGLNFTHAVAQAWEAGKLFHIDLNDQNPGRYDQDFRFGAANPRAAFFLVKFLEDVGYDGPRHFDAHAYRTEDYEGVKAFARGCMRTYLILKEKAARWNADPEIQAIVQGRARRQRVGGRASAPTARARSRTARSTARPSRPAVSATSNSISSRRRSSSGCGRDGRASPSRTPYLTIRSKSRRPRPARGHVRPRA